MCDVRWASVCVDSGHLGIVQTLLSAGASVGQAEPEGGATSLLIACARGHRSVALALLRAGADANQTDDNQNAPLFAASTCGDLDLVRALLAAGAVVDNVNISGWGALSEAAQNGARAWSCVVMVCVCGL